MVLKTFLGGRDLNECMISLNGHTPTTDTNHDSRGVNYTLGI